MTGKTKRLRDWARSVPPFLAINAIEIATSSDDVWGVLEDLRLRRQTGMFDSLPPAKVWLKFYRRHRILGPIVGEQLGLDDPGGPTALDFAGELRAFDRMGTNERRSWFNELSEVDKKAMYELMYESHRALKEDVEEQIKQVESYASGTVPGDSDRARDMVASPEIQFVIRILVPCWTLYQVYPCELLRAARSGDLEALERILQLDKTVMSDPKIIEHIHQIHHGMNKAKKQRLDRAIAASSPGRVSRKSVKVGSAALVAQIAKDLRFPLTEPRVRELFDAIAVINGQLRDADLPKSPEALSKALQRKKPEWAPMFGRTKVLAQMSG